MSTFKDTIQNKKGMGVIEGLIALGVISTAAVAITHSMTFENRVRRDTVSNSEIVAFFDRIQKIVGTEWSCTASLAGANVFNGISLKDPVNSAQNIAFEGSSHGPFWNVSQIRIQNPQPLASQSGVYTGTLYLEVSKNMSFQTGSPTLHRAISNLVYLATEDGTITRCYPGRETVASAKAACEGLGGSWDSDRSIGSQCVASSTPAPAATPAPVCLDSKSGVVILANSNAALSGNARVDGNIALMSGTNLDIVGNASVGGVVNAASGASVSTSGKAEVSSNVGVNLDSLSNSILVLSESAGRLSENVLNHGIDGSQTITGNGSFNVIKVDGDINLSGNDVVTIIGGSNDVFIFNVTGKITVTGNANIVLNGVPPQHVLFNNIGSGKEIVLSGNGNVAGTFLAVDRGAEVSGNGALNGGVIAGGGVKAKVTVSGNGLVLTSNPYCSQVTQP
jgi:hypothetical protein